MFISILKDSVITHLFSVAAPRPHKGLERDPVRDVQAEAVSEYCGLPREKESPEDITQFPETSVTHDEVDDIAGSKLVLQSFPMYPSLQEHRSGETQLPFPLQTEALEESTP